MTRRQTPRQDVCQMDQRMTGKEGRESHVRQTRAIDVESRPAEYQPNYEEDYAEITNKVWIEWTRMRDSCWKVRVPRQREEQHPCAIDDTQNAKDEIDELQHWIGCFQLSISLPILPPAPAAQPMGQPVTRPRTKLNVSKPGPSSCCQVRPSSVEKSAPDGPTATRIDVRRD